MSTAGSNELPIFGDTVRDRVVSITRGALGAVPGIGSILAELVGQFIPNQRLERIEDYLRRLDERIAMFSETDTPLLSAPAAIDLIEEGGFQSARATSEDRREHIVRIVADGLSGDERKRIESKRLLRLLGELDDDQIIILVSYLRKNLENDTFRAQHRHLLGPRNVSTAEPIEVIEASTAREIAHNALERLGLLRQMLPNRKPDEPPRFDLYGKIMGGHTLPSRSGLCLLRAIGLADHNDY